MKKLTFKYGTMASSKTTQLLICAHNYKLRHLKILIIKPSVDTRFGENKIVSRIGIDCDVDLNLKPNESLINNNINYDSFDCILVDEAQFLSSFQVEELRNISEKVNVIAYGLKTDFRTKLFEGSKRLIELSDSIEEIESLCNLCSNKSLINMKHKNNKKISNCNKTIELGCEELYMPVCWKCWKKF